MIVVCYSGGHSSALCAIEAVRRYGKENVILLNHDISPLVEDADIKRFKKEVAEYLGLEITYANHDRWETATPISVCLDERAWKVGNGSVLCTNRLKTEPFKRWIAENDYWKENTYVYGFDSNPKEMQRAQRRAQIMGLDELMTDFPLILWERTIKSTLEIGIKPPMTYAKFRHANCVGCLKASWQHWYVVYCLRPDVWEEAKKAEEEIGYAIHKNDDGPLFLEDKETMFKVMKESGVRPTEHIPSITFWKDARAIVAYFTSDAILEEIEGMNEEDQIVCLDCQA